MTFGYDDPGDECPCDKHDHLASYADDHADDEDVRHLVRSRQKVADSTLTRETNPRKWQECLDAHDAALRALCERRNRNG